MSDRLIVAHYRTQSTIADATEAVVRRMFAAVFDPKDIAGSWRRLEPLLVALVQQRHQVSAGVASNFVAAYRASLGVSGRFVPTVDDLLPADDIVPWLRAAPAEAFTALDAGQNITKAAIDQATGAVTRMTLDGGRNTTLLNTERDPRCIGWRRAARGTCCAFCAMLAGRAQFYSSKQLALRGGYTGAEAPEEQRYHHNCKCTAVPVYTADQPLPPNGEKFQQLWRESTKGTKGAESRKAFRRAHEGRTAPAAKPAAPAAPAAPPAAVNSFMADFAAAANR